MKTINKIKEIGRRYVAPTVLAASLYLGAGNAYANLPVNEETKQVLINKQERAEIEKQNYLERAVNKFNGALTDGRFTRREQKEVYRDLRKAGLPNAETSTGIKELYQAIGTVDTRKIEQELAKEGLKVDVGGRSVGEVVLPMLVGATLGSALILSLLYLFHKLEEDC